MNSHNFDEMETNEALAQEHYYTVRDAVSMVLTHPTPISMHGLAYGIADDMSAKELTELVAKLDEIINQKIDSEAYETARRRTDESIDKLIAKSDKIFGWDVSKQLGQLSIRKEV